MLNFSAAAGCPGTPARPSATGGGPGAQRAASGGEPAAALAVTMSRAKGPVGTPSSGLRYVPVQLGVCNSSAAACGRRMVFPLVPLQAGAGVHFHGVRACMRQAVPSLSVVRPRYSWRTARSVLRTTCRWRAHEATDWALACPLVLSLQPPTGSAARSLQQKGSFLNCMCACLFTPPYPQCVLVPCVQRVLLGCVV